MQNPSGRKCCTKGIMRILPHGQHVSWPDCHCSRNLVLDTKLYQKKHYSLSNVTNSLEQFYDSMKIRLSPIKELRGSGECPFS